jgi:hypothetical protein
MAMTSSTTMTKMNASAALRGREYTVAFCTALPVLPHDGRIKTVDCG